MPATMNSVYQMPLLNVDRLLKLSVVEEHLAKIFEPVPDRETICAMIEDGTLEGRQIGPGKNWFVYSSSLNEFILSIQSPRQQKLAA